MKHGALYVIPETDDTVYKGNTRHAHDKEARMWQSHVKTMLITSFNVKVIIHFKFIPQDQKVNQV